MTEQIPQSGRGPLPDGSTRMWSPITSTLIMGNREAVLVDPPMTLKQAAQVSDWVAASGRQLRDIYITHGHGDHWFGAIPLLERFPGVTVRATVGTTKLMTAQNDPQFRAAFWDSVFPSQLPVGDLEVTVVDERGFDLEAEQLVPIEAGHTDTDATTMLHVPATGLLVAGDVVYNGVHLYLTESDGVGGIEQWLSALDTAEMLHPVTVIAGHKAHDRESYRQRRRRNPVRARSRWWHSPDDCRTGQCRARPPAQGWIDVHICWHRTRQPRGRRICAYICYRSPKRPERRTGGAS